MSRFEHFQLRLTLKIEDILKNRNGSLSCGHPSVQLCIEQ